MDKGKITRDTKIGPIVEMEISLTIEVEETYTKTEIIGPSIEVEVDQETMGMEMATEGITVHKIIEETITDKTVVTVSSLGLHVSHLGYCEHYANAFNYFFLCLLVLYILN